ncbi:MULTISPECIES: DUF4124 domain-containing protein [Ralstonia solanacearum species complex]|uniref:DUF4124 domain-containing protein n=3 Tax=Ralstonia solanacearum species complex TaxID=3116862 RepID=A0A223GJ37_9RALS|nr:MULTISPECIES: DUF4124 domain-containing protein [Ralstonia]AOE88532.1 hypothetical protein LBM341_00214 [Ralstonia solanacearum]APC67494.1 DUF4124 domain-containing protein [Ralstonia solanacearum OE1-1]APF88271.1 hypothetical protein BCR16_16455 [Ralstonia solanacearum FJAT-1458]ARS54992.1 hypothetical protein BC427_02005 [Ralstonia solanacearum FJAT-91]AST26079.1 DUF4124 domain-containing protein [Ralstonia pseudosolanacearum]
MKPPIPSSRPRAPIALALGLWAAATALPAAGEVYRCTENGQTVYSDHPCGSRAVTVPLLDSTPSAADQKAARERAADEAVQVREAQTARRKAQAAEDARLAAETRLAAEAAEQARRDQERARRVQQDVGARYCHRVYVGPMPYPYPVPMVTPPAPIPTPIPTPMPRIVPGQQAGNSGGKPLPFVQAPVTRPAPIVPRPPHLHPPAYRIVCEPGYVYDGPEDLLPVE